MPKINALLSSKLDTQVTAYLDVTKCSWCISGDECPNAVLLSKLHTSNCLVGCYKAFQSATTWKLKSLEEILLVEIGRGLQELHHKQGNDSCNMRQGL